MQGSEDFMATLAASARRTVSEGYYDVEAADLPRRSLLASIRRAEGAAIITEVKFRSPAEGVLRRAGDAGAVARAYELGGASGISVLTEPRHFEGRLEHLAQVKRAVGLPVLMKDIVVDPVQLEAARKVGADAVLLIMHVFEHGLSKEPLEAMVGTAHELGLEVLLEAHTDAEYGGALRSEADLVGINNRDLKTLAVSLDVSRTLLQRHGAPKPVVCESGISRREEIAELRELGASAFLVGTALMRSDDPAGAVRGLRGER